MKRTISTGIILLVLSFNQIFAQDLPVDFFDSEIIVEALTPEELLQRKIANAKAAQDSSGTSLGWAVDQFTLNKQFLHFTKDYKPFIEMLEKKGIRFKELTKNEFAEAIMLPEKGKYYVTQDFTVEYVVIIQNVKLLSPNKEVLYVGSWKSLRKDIKKTPHNNRIKQGL